jgi:hypothetical protein
MQDTLAGLMGMLHLHEPLAPTSHRAVVDPAQPLRLLRNLGHATSSKDALVRVAFTLAGIWKPDNPQANMIGQEHVGCEERAPLINRDGKYGRICMGVSSKKEKWHTQHANLDGKPQRGMLQCMNA